MSNMIRAVFMDGPLTTKRLMLMDRTQRLVVPAPGGCIEYFRWTPAWDSYGPGGRHWVRFSIDVPPWVGKP